MTLAYDWLNRLTNMVDAAGTNHYTYTSGGQLQTEGGLFGADIVTNSYVNRMRTALSLQQPSGAWTIGFHNRVIQERDGSNNPLVSYTRGGDLSGSLEGAGGIGGLLALSTGYSGGNWTTHYFYHADGNGSITYLVNSSQTLAATYRYDPFGNTVSSSGTLASANVYRFSSKECHANSGMYYFLYRFYAPNLQRWLTRDPAQERAGINLYRFTRNTPLRFADPFGLQLPAGGGYWDEPFIEPTTRGGRVCSSLLQLGDNCRIWEDDPDTHYGCPYGCPPDQCPGHIGPAPAPPAPPAPVSSPIPPWPGAGCSTCTINAPPPLVLTNEV